FNSYGQKNCYMGLRPHCSKKHNSRALSGWTGQIPIPTRAPAGLKLNSMIGSSLPIMPVLWLKTTLGCCRWRALVWRVNLRLLRSWLLRPSIDAAEINGRLDAVDVLRKETVQREELRRGLDGILDLERLLSRVTLETANPRDVLALAASLAKIPWVRASLTHF